jgi:L-ascorbate metabolism protein UlaG (beta-lactamase superfamily)
VNIDESYMTYYAGEPSDHFDGREFFNPWARRPEKGFLDMLKWRFNGQRADWPESVANPLRPALVAAGESLRATYIGHATFLVQADGKNILLDPVFSERCSPFASIGPKRVRKPFVPMENLPKIDAVFVSHNHYDHLDQASLSWLANNHAPAFYTPLGKTRLIESCTGGKCALHPLDWHQEAGIASGLTITLTPAQHWSRRGLGDINRDLWGGAYLRTSKGKSLFFSGDSGFDQALFEGIGKRHGAPDIALLPIGAYEPRWFMKYSHMNPAEAVAIHQILKAKKSIAFHFETFQLTDEAFDAPRTHTQNALKEAGLTEEDFLIPYPGDYIEV